MTIMPWDRLPYEPAGWYARFQTYLYAPVPRSMMAIYNQVMAEKGRERPYTTVSAGWKKAVEKWKWKERAEAWDIEQARLRALEWQRRIEQQRDTEWELSEKLADKAKIMLNFPLTRMVTEKYPDGRDKQIIEPAEWHLRDIPRVAEMASKLGRLASNQETERIGLSIDDVLNALPSEFREAVRTALAEGLSEGRNAAGNSQ